MRHTTPRAVAIMLVSAGLGLGARAAELDALRSDTDPTKPVLFSLRNEYYSLLNDASVNVSILRMDRLVLKDVGMPGGARGSILRLDLPYQIFDNDRMTRSGLSDVYGQALEIPKLRNGFTVAYGLGLVAPTATDRALGGGKWQAGPAIIPAQFFPGRVGFAFVKFQDFISFAGAAGRRPIHRFLATPTVLYRLSRELYALVDGESQTDWHDNARTTLKSGLLVGWMFHNRSGASLKVEAPWGEHRTGDWTFKATVFVTRY